MTQNTHQKKGTSSNIVKMLTFQVATTELKREKKNAKTLLGARTPSKISLVKSFKINCWHFWCKYIGDT